MPIAYESLPRTEKDEKGHTHVAWEEVGMQCLTHDPATGDPLIVKKENREYKGARLLRVSDLDKARKYLGDEAMLAALDGSSFRVSQQDVNRSYLLDCATNKKVPSPDVLESRLWNRLIGIRRAAEIGPRKPVIVEVKVRVIVLPDGTEWKPEPGSDVALPDQARSAYLNAYLEKGVPAEIAKSLVASLDFEKMLNG